MNNFERLAINSPSSVLTLGEELTARAAGMEPPPPPPPPLATTNKVIVPSKLAAQLQQRLM
jgi:hypothetical protein